jgi:hypothetical protein
LFVSVERTKFVVVEPQDFQAYHDVLSSLPLEQRQRFLLVILRENDRGVAYARHLALVSLQLYLISNEMEWMYMVDDDLMTALTWEFTDTTSRSPEKSTTKHYGKGKWVDTSWESLFESLEKLSLEQDNIALIAPTCAADRRFNHPSQEKYRNKETRSSMTLQQLVLINLKLTQGHSYLKSDILNMPGWKWKNLIDLRTDNGYMNDIQKYVFQLEDFFFAGQSIEKGHQVVCLVRFAIRAMTIPSEAKTQKEDKRSLTYPIFVASQSEWFKEFLRQSGDLDPQSSAERVAPPPNLELVGWKRDDIDCFLDCLPISGNESGEPVGKTVTAKS